MQLTAFCTAICRVLRIHLTALRLPVNPIENSSGTQPTRNNGKYKWEYRHRQCMGEYRHRQCMAHRLFIDKMQLNFDKTLKYL